MFRPGTRRRFCDRSIPPTGRHEPAACDGHSPGQARLGPPGPHTASPMQGHVPATAPRPASGDADQTPLGNRGGMRYDYYPIGILSSRNLSRDDLPQDWI